MVATPMASELVGLLPAKGLRAGSFWNPLLRSGVRSSRGVPVAIISGPPTRPKRPEALLPIDYRAVAAAGAVHFESAVAANCFHSNNMGQVGECVRNQRS